MTDRRWFSDSMRLHALQHIELEPIDVNLYEMNGRLNYVVQRDGRYVHRGTACWNGRPMGPRTEPSKPDRRDVQGLRAARWLRRTDGFGRLVACSA